MDFGMPTLIEASSLEACACLCRELNLQFVELNMNLPEYQLEQIDSQKLSALALKYGIYFTIHLDENLNPCDFNSLVSDAWLQTVLDTIELAKRCGIPVLNMHLAKGVYFTLPDSRVYLFEKYRSQYEEKLWNFCAKCERAIGDSEVCISLENTDNWTPFERNSLQTLLKSGAFGLTFDIGHSHSAGGRDEPFLLEHLEKLHHFHLHDAKGAKNHLPFGTGEIELGRYLRLAQSLNGRAVLEVKTVSALRESVCWLQKYERGLLRKQ